MALHDGRMGCGVLPISPNASVSFPGPHTLYRVCVLEDKGNVSNEFLQV